MGMAAIGTPLVLFDIKLLTKKLHRCVIVCKTFLFGVRAPHLHRLYGKICTDMFKKAHHINKEKSAYCTKVILFYCFIELNLYSF